MHTVPSLFISPEASDDGGPSLPRALEVPTDGPTLPMEPRWHFTHPLRASLGPGSFSQGLPMSQFTKAGLVLVSYFDQPRRRRSEERREPWVWSGLSPTDRSAHQAKWPGSLATDRSTHTAPLPLSGVVFTCAHVELGGFEVI